MVLYRTRRHRAFMEDEMGDLFGADEHRDGILRRISPKLCSIADFIVARCCTRYGRSPFHIFYNSGVADDKAAHRGESLIAVFPPGCEIRGTWEREPALRPAGKEEWGYSRKLL